MANSTIRKGPMMHRKVLMRIDKIDPVALGVMIGTVLGAIFAAMMLAVR